MSARPPTRRPPTAAPPVANPSGNPASPSGSVPEGTSSLGTYLKRLRSTLASIESNPKTHTTARAILSGYYRFINPRMTCEDFPRSLRRHPANPEAGFEGGNKYLVLYFHVGNALDALYEAHKSANLNLALLEKRVQLLERLATRPVEGWFLIGDERKGFRLDITRSGIEGPKVRNNPLFGLDGELKK